MTSANPIRSAVLLIVAACAVACAPTVVERATPVTEPMPVDSAAPATDGHPPAKVEAVSASSVLAEQIAATDACLITDSTHRLVSSFGFKGLRGAARVVPARALPDYVPLWGIEPEIQTDDPAWAFWFEGMLTIPIDITERDPLCVVVDGEASWFSVGASYIDGNWVEAKPPPGGGPTRVLPAVQP